MKQHQLLKVLSLERIMKLIQTVIQFINVLIKAKLVPFLTAALQEEIARREALEDQYNALADRITALEP